jgi:cytochrome c553|tara:strand:- start:1379 stop:1672 length:294 start_codon:yes stop_codon:yes gene_type:complete
MKKIYGLLIFLTIIPFLVTPVLAVDLENGKSLHDDNCLRCHDESKYTRKNRIVKNFQQLYERIKQCELMAELTWFDEEIADVTAYLNNQFYYFNLEK